MSDALTEAVTRLHQDCAFRRLGLVKGTPEKYPATKVCVRILDLEAALAALASVPARSPDALTEALQAAWDEYMVTGEWEILRDVVRDAALARSAGDGGEQG